LSEELLARHEEYLQTLQSEWELKAPVIAKVREWFALAEEERELENRMHDPNRFKKGGAAMLQEEKMRKRVTLLKPRVSISSMHRRGELR
jgi:protein regulator of cytokinesis 1